jgi:long-chain acyl-CoA synthetase
VIRQVRRHRITLVVTVPRLLEMLRDRVRVRLPACAHPPAIERPLAVRLWQYREIRRLFWWRFCGFVVGGAQLDVALEDFWRRLGFAVIQGYGLTETAPMAAWNHPFKIKHGTVGRPLEGNEIRIAADGEILVRGPCVTRGYLDAPEQTRTALEGGWLHTGDLGALDESGHLVVRGRKKDVIVMPDGLKVVPEDVERVLEQLPGVREAAVVGRRVDGAEQVHAVLVLDRPGAVPAEMVRQANLALEPHQRIRGCSVWPGAALPRTDAIRKLKRVDIRRWLEAGAPAPAAPARGGDMIEDLLARYAGDRRVESETTFDELGLSSLDRIELMTALEDRASVALSESAMSRARTVGDLRAVVAQAAAGGATAADAIAFPRWNRTAPIRFIRGLSLATWILPPARLLMALTIEGREHLDGVHGPVIFAANHQSMLDVPAVLQALPRRWRRRLAPPMWKEFFEPHFFPDRFGIARRLVNSTQYALAAMFFNAFPLPQIEPGVRETLRYIGELVSEGYSILIFPEGERTDRGEIKRFRPGVGMMASRLALPVVPVRLTGLDRVLHRTWRWPRRGPVRVIIGAPLRLQGEDYAGLARQIEDAVGALSPVPAIGAPAVA